MSSTKPLSETECAIIIANKALDRINADPDDDLAVLARQFLHANEKASRAPDKSSSYAKASGDKHVAGGDHKLFANYVKLYRAMWVDDALKRENAQSKFWDWIGSNTGHLVDAIERLLSRTDESQAGITKLQGAYYEGYSDGLGQADGGWTPQEAWNDSMTLHDHSTNETQAEETDDLQDCEHCGKSFGIEQMHMMEDFWFCDGFYAEWKAEFDACEHDWSPHTNTMSEEGRICSKCNGFVADESPEPAQPAGDAGDIEELIEPALAAFNAEWERFGDIHDGASASKFGAHVEARRRSAIEAALSAARTNRGS